MLALACQTTYKMLLCQIGVLREMASLLHTAVAVQCKKIGVSCVCMSPNCENILSYNVIYCHLLIRQTALLLAARGLRHPEGLHRPTPPSAPTNPRRASRSKRWTRNKRYVGGGPPGEGGRLVVQDKISYLHINEVVLFMLQIYIFPSSIWCKWHKSRNLLEINVTADEVALADAREAEEVDGPFEMTQSPRSPRFSPSGLWHSHTVFDMDRRVRQ